ncbi:diguanylate cyclase domain-containing protein [Oxalobacteraceae bacterium A2-2]
MNRTGSSLAFLRQLYRAILLPSFVLVLLATMWAAVIYQVGQERASAHADAVLQSRTLARTLGEHTNHLLRQTEHATQLFKIQYEAGGGRLTLAEFARRNGLLDSLLPSKLALPLALVGPDGRLRDSMNGWFAPDQGGMAYFKTHAAANEDMPVVSMPVVEPRTKKWQIQLSRRLNGPDGAFAGVIVIQVDPAYFVDDYDRISLDDDGALLLLSRDNALAVGRVNEQLVISDTLDLYRPPSATGAFADELVPSQPLDQVPRIYSYSDIARYTLMAVVGIPAHTAMARFERQRRMYYGAVTVASLLMLGFIGLLTQQHRRLRRSQAELTAVNDASPLGLIHADPDGHCTYVNRTFEAVTGLTREEALGDAWIRAVHPNDRPQLQAALKQLVDSGQPQRDTVRCVHPDGTLLWIAFKIAPMVVDGKAIGYVGTVDDITHLRKSVIALGESEARLRTIADSLPAMVAYIDEEQVYRFHNVAYEREFNRSGSEVLGKSVLETVGPERYAFLQPYIERALAGETLDFEEQDDSGLLERYFEVAYIPQMDQEGLDVIGFHVMRQDITSQKREKQRLLKLSQVDALTGLTNRAGFLQKLTDSMQSCRAQGGMMAVMYMDIDRFKPVNDTYGHSVGDALLKAFSLRLAHAVRASDTIARLGGDEFTIILEQLHRHQDADGLAAKIVQAMRAPFDLDGKVVDISASIGMAYYHGEELTPAELLNRADVLLYEAKQAGRDTFRAGPVLPARVDAA